MDTAAREPTAANPIDRAPGLSPAELRRAAAASIELERRLRWRRDPVAWFRERVKIEPWEKQVEIIESVRDHRKTHVRSGHKVGKTVVAGGLTLWFLDCWRPSRVITSSASWLDVKMKLWGHVRSYYRKNGEWFGVKIHDEALRINDEHYALGLSPKTVEPFQGHNAEHVLVIFDEASAFSDAYFDAADAQASRMLAIGNPLLAEGPFYRFARSAEWSHIRISCLDHPNVLERRMVIPGGPTLEWVEGRKQYWGETSPLYQTRVAGEFPEESSDTLFPLSAVRKAFELWRLAERLPRAEDASIALGLDVARAGGDRTIGYEKDHVLLEGKLTARARKALELKKTEHHATRMKVTQLHQGRRYDRMNIDAGGEGSGPADEMAAAGLPVRRIHFGGRPSHKDYFDIRAEMYWQLSADLKAGMAVEPDDELEEELSVVGGMAGLKEKSVDGTKRVVFWLPPKDEMKQKLGRSPDKADGLALANYQRRSYDGAQPVSWVQ